MRSLEQFAVGRFAINGVYHDALGLDVAQGFKPGCHILLAGVVGSVAFEKHGLYNDVAVELFQVLDNLSDVVRRLRGAVDATNVFVVDGVEFQYVIVNFHQGLTYVGAAGKG